MERLHYFVVDAFTDRPFHGNPAAVVLLTEWLDPKLLQAISMEMNLSETAFLVPQGTSYELRWFTPTVEVDLCGHATLAAAKVLVALERLDDQATVEFLTRSGKLCVTRFGDRLSMDFPSVPSVEMPAPPGLLESLGIAGHYVGKNAFDYLVEVDSEATLRSMTPNFLDLKKVECRGIIVTACSKDSEVDFVSRFFAPAAGIDEDPVTGSAHCCLAPFWQRRFGKDRMIGFQVSQRGGLVEVVASESRVQLIGQAVLFAEGNMMLPSGSVR